jgi:autotransporter translocation and assembly factor TamB
MVYGLRIPAASANFDLDINALRIRATDVRVADTLDHLEGAKGPLDLRGFMDMDAKGERWTAELKGAMDSAILGLPGPRLTGQVEGRIDGPLTAPLGPSQAPEGTLALTGGRLTLEGQSVEGLEARFSFKDGRVQGQAGLQGMAAPAVTFDGLQIGHNRLTADLNVHLGPDSSDSAAVASRLSQGFLRDLKLDFAGQGEWTPAGLRWKGVLHDFQGSFEGFQLAQGKPSTFSGDLTGMNLAMDLEGRTVAEGGAPSPNATSMRLGGWLPFNPEGALAMKLEGTAELANLKAIVDHLVDPGQYSLMADLKPAGSATFDLSLVGRPSEPALEGRLDLKGGRLTARTYPQSIENVDFTARFHGRDITIPQDEPLRGTLAQGALAAWGRLTWGFHGLTDYDFSATLEDFQFRDLPEGFEIQGSLNGSLRGNDRDGGLLKGAIRAKSMLYQADVNLTDIILAGALGGSALRSLDPSDPLARIELDLDLQLARPWEFDTNLLKLQGRPTGAFKIRGSLAHPGLKGRMEFLPGGRLTNLLPAGDLVLERGSVEFTDPAVFNPIVDLHGRVDVDPYLVTLDISGTLDAITAHPSSTPALRPDEIFAILVDPAAVTKVGGTQGAPSQASVNTGIFTQGAGLLTSLFMANGLERLRKTLGLDRVNFAILGGPNLSLTLEKSWDILGHRMPLIYNYKQEGTQTTISGNVELRFGNFVVQVGARQVTGASQTPGDTTVQGVQPSGEIRYTWTPK